MFNFFKDKIKKATKKLFNLKSKLGLKIKNLFSKKIDSNFLQELEQILYEADLGVDTTTEIINSVEKEKVDSFEALIKIIKNKLDQSIVEPNFTLDSSKKPYVILIIGVNGTGKTTSIAKLANLYKKKGKKVLLAAGDTFRAAATEQLTKWAEKLKIDIIKSHINADPAAVVYDALEAAKARDIDIVLVDTAGRLQNKLSLMEELKKITKVMKKSVKDAPHFTYLTLDATTGQNALDQTETFNQFTKIDGIVLSKLDGSSKGGIVVAISKKLNIPVIWAGIGENIDDLVAFEKEKFIEELLDVKNE